MKGTTVTEESTEAWRPNTRMIMKKGNLSLKYLHVHKKDVVFLDVRQQTHVYDCA